MIHRGCGYRGCRSSFTVGRWPIPVAGSMICSISCTTGRRCRWRSTGWSATPGPGPRGSTACGPRTSRDCPAGLRGSWTDLRASVKDGSFRPLPVRQRLIPKGHGSGKLRSLGIPTVADRVVQAALKLVLEPIFEADFLPVSYGFRPNRRAHDAVAEIQRFGTQGYRWVLDADIEACLDAWSYCFLSDCHGWNSACSGAGGSMRSPFRRPVRT